MNLAGIGIKKNSVKDEGIIDFDDTVISEISQIDLAEQKRIDTIVSQVLICRDKNKLTELISQILSDDNVAQILKQLSMEREFRELFPEFYEYNKYGENLFNCVQNNSYHRYDLFKHITTTIEEVGKNSQTLGEGKRKILNWTMLLHDIGKPYVKIRYEDGGESFAGHEDKSYELSINILDRFAFTDEEKKVILTLVKYHDKYLNEGELTYANFKELAMALENSKEKFNLLIMVKDADASAKSIEVYQKYKITRTKYIEFVNNYFEDVITKNNVNITINSDGIVNEDASHAEENNEPEEISNIEFDSIIDGVINRTKIESLYQPIINIVDCKVVGYEVLSKIQFGKKVDIEQFLKYAEDKEQYNKIQQMLFIHGLESFAEISMKESNKVNVNINLKSYELYVNKPRIYELMDKSKVTIELHGYERYDFPTLQQFITDIHKRNGKVALDHFGTGIMELSDFRMLTPDMIKLDRSVVQDILENEEKQKYVSDLQTMCITKDIDLVAVGVSDRKVLNKLKQLGVKYVQGYYLAYPSENIEFINEKLEQLINDEETESIV